MQTIFWLDHKYSYVSLLIVIGILLYILDRMSWGSSLQLLLNVRNNG
jgi:hypothetical protein